MTDDNLFAKQTNSFKDADKAIVHLFAALAGRNECPKCSGFGIDSKHQFQTCQCTKIATVTVARSADVFCKALEHLMLLESLDGEGIKTAISTVSDIYFPDGYSISRLAVEGSRYEIDITCEGVNVTYTGDTLHEAFCKAACDSHKLFDKEDITDAK